MTAVIATKTKSFNYLVDDHIGRIMDTKVETTLTEFVPDKQSPSRQSLENGEVQSEISVDYAGASRKTNPAEIALVRKLDLCMMVSFRSCRIRHQSDQ